MQPWANWFELNGSIQVFSFCYQS